METLLSAVDTLKTCCTDYDDNIKKSANANSALKKSIDRMVVALADMKKLFTSNPKCGICCTRVVDTALECGHTSCASCAARALRAERCPFCRHPVTATTKLYL